MPTKTKSKKSDTTLKQSLFIGLGLVDLTREKVEKYISGLKKDLPEKERRKAADDFIKSVKSNSKEMERSVRQHLKKTLDQMSSKVDPDKKVK